MFLACVLVIAFCGAANSRLDFFRDPALRYNTTQLIEDAGFDSEVYSTTTEDGYILPLFRIVTRDGSAGTGNRPPVLLMHGMFSASDNWLLQGRRKDLAFIMADAGYDVWIGDFRGNIYARKHVSMSPSDPLFWQFSFHEMGMYDLPALLDKVLSVTGRQQLSYISHSMGGTNFYVMASAKPELTQRINIVIAMAPSATWDPSIMTSEKHFYYSMSERLAKSFERQGQWEVFPRTWFAPYLAYAVCGPDSITQDLCYDVGFFWAGSRTNRIARKVVPRVVSHAPAGSSLNVPKHFLMAITTGVFAPMDYGAEMNARKYGSVGQQPKYNISRVLCPVSIHYSTTDGVVEAHDVKMNLPLLKHVLTDVFEYPDQSHIDYMWGAHAYRQVYPNVLRTLDRFNNDPHR